MIHPDEILDPEFIFLNGNVYSVTYLKSQITEPIIIKVAPKKKPPRHNIPERAKYFWGIITMSFPELSRAYPGKTAAQYYAMKRNSKAILKSEIGLLNWLKKNYSNIDI